MEENKVYPYLGKTEIDGKVYVVLFSEPNYGVCVMTEYDGVKFGEIGDFSEEIFVPLENDVCVRLQN